MSESTSRPFRLDRETVIRIAACPVCAAPIGTPCAYPSKKTARFPRQSHQSRRDLAIAKIRRDGFSALALERKNGYKF